MKSALSFILIALVVSSTPSASHAAYGDITLVGTTTVPNITWVADVWGWMDTATNREYAVVGEGWTTAFHIVDITNPFLPTVIKTVNSPGFDVKVHNGYLYTCDGNGSGIDSRVWDLSDPSNPVLVGSPFRSAHNITISPDGYLYTEYYGWSGFDLNGDPTAPTQLFTTGAIPNGHDCTVKGNRVYSFTGYAGVTNVWDVSNHNVPNLLGTVSDPSIVYNHSGDTDETESYLYVTDELAVDTDTTVADVIIFDITNLASPVRVNDIRLANTTVHNLYVVGDFMFVSYYTDGFHVYDVSNPASPVLLDKYDTFPGTGEGYDGAFGVYPFSPSGHILVSDSHGGLFIFEVEGYGGPVTAITPAATNARASLGQNYPNPFNPSTTIDFSLQANGNVSLRVYDVTGRLVKTLLDDTRGAGPHHATWDGTTDSGARAASGVYHYRLEFGGETLTQRMVMLK